MVADHFLYTLGDDSYYPEGAKHIRLFGMYHANTSPHRYIMLDADGVVRIVFHNCGMGVNMVGVNTIWHYAAPSTLDD